MLGPALSAHAFNLHFCERQCEGLNDDAILHRPGDGLHVPAWILGRLAAATDRAGKFLGLDRVCDASWHRAFGRGSSGEVELDPAPTKDQLLDAIRRWHARVADAVARGVDRERMEQPHGIPHLDGTPIRTVGDVVLHLMTNHEAVHLGQLSVCRRVLGFQPIL